MHVIRPIRLDDLETLIKFANNASLGITNMPRNRERLQKHIAISLQSFKKTIQQPKHESYIFVLEDSSMGTVGGISGIFSKSGMEESLFFYRIETLKKADPELPLPKEMGLLKAASWSNGPTEIAILYLDPSFRKSGLGKLLSLSRFLFMACFPHNFEETVIAEMRGVIDKENNSPFWDGFGSYFLNVDFPSAMQLLEKGKTFIPRFLPDFPIYIDLLPKEVQNTIGKVHQKTEPALSMLQNEGFAFINCVDVFDGGPMISAKRNSIKTVKESLTSTISHIVDEEIAGDTYIICNQQRQDFRACYGTLAFNEKGEVSLNREISKILHVVPGDPIRYIKSVKTPRNL